MSGEPCLRTFFKCIRYKTTKKTNFLHLNHDICFMCMNVLPTCSYVRNMHEVPEEAQRGLKSPGTRVTDGCEPPCGC